MVSSVSAEFSEDEEDQVTKDIRERVEIVSKYDKVSYGCLIYSQLNCGFQTGETNSCGNTTLVNGVKVAY